MGWRRDSRASRSTILPKSLRSSRSASRCLGSMERRAYLGFMEGAGWGEEDGDGDGEAVSPYFWEISWIARSTSSRAEAAGIEGAVSFGVEGVDAQSFDVAATFFFFFLFLDFLAGVEGAGSSDTAMVSSSSDGCVSFS